MGGVIGLDKGAQTIAANVLLDAAYAMDRSLTSLGETINAHAGGYVGLGANTLAEALNTWFPEARAVPAAMATYAGLLHDVDVAAIAADASGSQALEGSGSGLNMR